MTDKHPTIREADNRLVVRTSRLSIFLATEAEMEELVAAQPCAELRQAYTEMLTGSRQHPQEREWYAVWIMVRADGTRVGDLCFKGVDERSVSEVGYGVYEPYQGQGYASEAVKAMVAWALGTGRVMAVEAEVEDDNLASQRVLAKCGFAPTGIRGEEGARYAVTHR